MAALRMNLGAAPEPGTGSLLLPVLPLDDVCLLPGASLSLVLDRPASVTAVQLATRSGDRLLALARYLHAHADLRSFLEAQRRSPDAMAWVNLACQHLPITASARQKLLEANAAERCLKISRGLDALLKKEQG